MRTRAGELVQGWGTLLRLFFFLFTSSAAKRTWMRIFKRAHRFPSLEACSETRKETDERTDVINLFKNMPRIVFTLLPGQGYVISFYEGINTLSG